MFGGTYYNSIDSKGRVIVPAKFREGLGETFILTQGLDHCLFIYNHDEWEDFVGKIKQAPLSSTEGRRLSRFFFANMTEAEVDKQGRLMIPANLRKYAHIEKELVTIGVDSRIEIWSKENWEAYNSDEEDDIESILPKLEAFNI